MKILIGEIVLASGNDKNEQPYDFKINHSRQIQIVSSIRALAVRSLDRGNQQTTLEFKISKRHASVEEAQLYMMHHTATLRNLTSVLTIIVEPSQEGYQLNDAVICDIQSASEGIVSTHIYKVIGGNFTKN